MTQLKTSKILCWIIFGIGMIAGAFIVALYVSYQFQYGNYYSNEYDVLPECSRDGLMKYCGESFNDLCNIDCYELLGFREYKIYEASDGDFIITENPELFRGGDIIWIKKK